MLHRLGQRLGSVAPVLPAADRAAASAHMNAAPAVEAVVHGDGAAVERHGEGDDLEGGAGLVGVGQGLVAPLARLRLPQQLLGLLGRGGRVDHGLRLGADGKKIVQIIAVERGHGEDRAGVHIHGDGAGAVLNVVVRDGLLQMLFDIILDRRIERQHQVAAVLAGLKILVAAQQQLRAVGVRQAQRAAAGAGQRLIVHGLDALETGVVGADKADHMAGKRRIRVIAAAVRLEMHAVQAVLQLEGAHRVGLLALHAPLDRHIPGAGLPALFEHRLLVDVQDFRKAPGDQRPVLAVLVDLRRTEEDVFHRGAERQGLPLPVIDPAARDHRGRLAQLLADRQLLVIIMVGDLQPVEPQDQQHKGRHAENRHQRQDAAQHPAVRRAVGSLFRHKSLRRIPFVLCIFHGLSD